jgi:hypothetical protein
MKAPSKKMNSRWRRGATRYDGKTLEVIYEKYHERYGWWHGARVRRR